MSEPKYDWAACRCGQTEFNVELELYKETIGYTIICHHCSAPWDGKTSVGTQRADARGSKAVGRGGDEPKDVVPPPKRKQS